MATKGGWLSPLGPHHPQSCLLLLPLLLRRLVPLLLCWLRFSQLLCLFEFFVCRLVLFFPRLFFFSGPLLFRIYFFLLVFFCFSSSICLFYCFSLFLIFFVFLLYFLFIPFFSSPPPPLPLFKSSVFFFLLGLVNFPPLLFLIPSFGFGVFPFSYYLFSLVLLVLFFSCFSSICLPSVSSRFIGLVFLFSSSSPASSFSSEVLEWFMGFVVLCLSLFLSSYVCFCFIYIYTHKHTFNYKFSSSIPNSFSLL